MLKIKKIISYSIIASLLATLFIFFCTPVIKKDIDYTITKSLDSYTIYLDRGIKPSIFDQVIISVRASNTNNTDYQYTSARLDTGTYSRDFRITIDGLSHTYFLYPAKDLSYLQEDTITSIDLSLPRLEEVEFSLRDLDVSRRMFYPADIRVSRFFMDIFELTGISNLLVAFYLLMIVLFILAGVFYLMFRPQTGSRSLVFIALVSLTLVFSIWFFVRSVYITKSYYDSYSDEIRQGRLEDTYKGFYGFERFIGWVDKKLPPEGDLIVFTRGEPVYLKSELAYNLYPRDIKFIDVSGIKKTTLISRVEKYSASNRYLVLLSPDDKRLLESIKQNTRLDFIMIDKYRDDAGYIFKIGG